MAELESVSLWHPDNLETHPSTVQRAPIFLWVGPSWWSDGSSAATWMIRSGEQPKPLPGSYWSKRRRPPARVHCAGWLSPPSSPRPGAPAPCAPRTTRALFQRCREHNGGRRQHVDLPSSDSLRLLYRVGSLGVGSEVIEHVFISESGPRYGSSPQIRRRPAGLSMR